MTNNAEFGMTLQKLICDTYYLKAHSKAIEQFNSSFNPYLVPGFSLLITKIFDELNSKPVKCLTFSPSHIAGERLSPHNFILANGATLSIRTNQSGDKVAPRVVGQCGLETFNHFFSEIATYEIKDKEQIKEIVYYKIHELLPTFIDYMFISDYTVWVKPESNSIYSYTIYDRNKIVDISLNRENFTFTRDLASWTESTTLKYNGSTLAEIQIHKNRTFKFRFKMSTLEYLLKDLNVTNETLGISAEAAVCKAFGLKIPDNYRTRISNTFVKDLIPTVKTAFLKLPNVVQSTGATSGERGLQSKCSYDFLLLGGKTLSLKTNTGNMVCPPEVGQPSAETCYLYFKQFINGESVTPENFKKMVYNHIDEIIPIYAEHLFDSDYLLWIFKKKNTYQHKIFNKNFASKKHWIREKFTFTKPTIDQWNESNTVKYDDITIGEFQVHSKRNCYKFRFNLENLAKLIENN